MDESIFRNIKMTNLSDTRQIRIDTQGRLLPKLSDSLNLAKVPNLRKVAFCAPIALFRCVIPYTADGAKLSHEKMP